MTRRRLVQVQTDKSKTRPEHAQRLPDKFQKTCEASLEVFWTNCFWGQNPEDFLSEIKRNSSKLSKEVLKKQVPNSISIRSNSEIRGVHSGSFRSVFRISRLIVKQRKLKALWADSGNSTSSFRTPINLNSTRTSAETSGVNSWAFWNVYRGLLEWMGEFLSWEVF